jgi:hypothetical protein
MGDVGVSTDWSRIGSNNSPDLSSDILHSLSLTETETELGSGAEAVLARTANLLSVGPTPILAFSHNLYILYILSLFLLCNFSGVVYDFCSWQGVPFSWDWLVSIATLYCL